MSRMLLPITLSPFLAALTLASCTGGSAVTSYGGPNTNPAEQYAAPNYGWGGGGVVHSNSVPGPVGPAEAGPRTGRACSTSYLWLVALGDSSIEAARIEGGVSEIATVEYQNFAVLSVVFHRFCTVVTGE